MTDATVEATDGDGPTAVRHKVNLAYPKDTWAAIFALLGGIVELYDLLGAASAGYEDPDASE